MRFVLTLLCILWSGPLFAAVTIDANSESSCTACNSDSWSHTTTGSNTVLVCSSAFSNSQTVATYTHNSLSLTLKAIRTHIARSVEMWFRIAPTTGIQTTAVSISGGGNDIASGCTSFTGAHQTAPLGTASFNTNVGDLETSPPSITVPANGIAYDVAFFFSGDDGCVTPTPGAGQTLRIDVCANLGPNASGIFGASTRATTGTMSWLNLTAAYQGQIAVPISEAVVGGSGRRSGVMVVE